MADPKRPEFTAEQLQEVRRLQALYPDKQGALLPVLRLAQEVFGYVSLEVEEYVAGLFEMSPAHVHEVVTFYTLFFQQPTGRHVVSVCHNLSCHLLGSKSIVEHLTRRFDDDPAATAATSEAASRFVLESYSPAVEAQSIVDAFAPLLQP